MTGTSIEKRKRLHEIGDIFNKWQKDRDEERYKNNREAAAESIVEGLRKAAREFPLFQEMQQIFGLLDHEQEPPHSVPAMALQFIEQEYIDVDKGAIQRHRDWLVKELMEGNGSFMKDYIALAHELNRWATKLKQFPSMPGTEVPEEPKAEWSRPMMKKRMMKALGIESEKTFRRWSEKQGIRGSGKTWELRLNGLSPAQREKLEKALKI